MAYVQVLQPDGLSQLGKSNQDVIKSYDSIVLWVWSSQQNIPAKAFGENTRKPFEIRVIGPAGVDLVRWNTSEPNKKHIIYHYKF